MTEAYTVIGIFLILSVTGLWLLISNSADDGDNDESDEHNEDVQ